MVILNNKYIQNRVRRMLTDIKAIVGHSKVFIRGSYRSGVNYISDLDIGITTPSPIKSNAAKYRAYIHRMLKQIPKRSTDGEPWVIQEVKFMNIDGKHDHHISINDSYQLAQNYIQIPISTTDDTGLIDAQDIITIDELIDRSENIAIYLFYPIDPKTHQYVKIDLQIYNVQFTLYDPSCDASIKRREIDIIKALKRLNACAMYLAKHQPKLSASNIEQLHRLVAKNKEIVHRYDLMRSILEAIGVAEHFHVHRDGLANGAYVADAMTARISQSIALFIKQHRQDVANIQNGKHPGPYNKQPHPNTDETARIHHNTLNKYTAWIDAVTQQLNKRYRSYYDKVYAQYLRLVTRHKIASQSASATNSHTHKRTSSNKNNKTKKRKPIIKQNKSTQKRKPMTN